MECNPRAPCQRHVDAPIWRWCAARARATLARLETEPRHCARTGLAIWLVANPDHIEGPVFGREDHWTGVGIFFDTFQNLDHSHHHKHPYIYAVMNDGTKGCAHTRPHAVSACACTHTPSAEAVGARVCRAAAVPRVQVHPRCGEARPGEAGAARLGGQLGLLL